MLANPRKASSARPTNKQSLDGANGSGVFMYAFADLAIGALPERLLLHLSSGPLRFRNFNAKAAKVV